MNIYETILHRRTVRKFKQERIEHIVLERLIDAARHAPSAANMQPLKYVIVDDKAQVDAVFKHLKWAAYIAPAGNPAENERPVAFIAVLVDTDIKKSGYELDIGAAVQNILLASAAEGIGTCWIASIDRDAIVRELRIPDQYILNTVIALGYAAEEPAAEEENGSIRYYKDENGRLHVPKRSLKDVIVNFV